MTPLQLFARHLWLQYRLAASGFVRAALLATMFGLGCVGLGLSIAVAHARLGPVDRSDSMALALLWAGLSAGLFAFACFLRCEVGVPVRVKPNETRALGNY